MARRRSPLFPLALLALGLAGGGWLARYGLPVPGPAATTDADIRAVDFRNFAYAPDCLRGEDGSGERIETSEGEFQRHGEFERIDFRVAQIVYGDLTGDGRDEAVVLTGCSTGGTAYLTEGMVYTLREGQPVEIGRVAAGSKAFGGLASLAIEQGQLVVERHATDEDGPHCCPRYLDTTRLRWDGKTLVPQGGTTRRPLPAD